MAPDTCAHLARRPLQAATCALCLNSALRRAVLPPAVPIRADKENFCAARGSVGPLLKSLGLPGMPRAVMVGPAPVAAEIKERVTPGKFPPAAMAAAVLPELNLPRIRTRVGGERAGERERERERVMKRLMEKEREVERVRERVLEREKEMESEERESEWEVKLAWLRQLQTEREGKGGREREREGEGGSALSLVKEYGRSYDGTESKWSHGSSSCSSSGSEGSGEGESEQRERREREESARKERVWKEKLMREAEERERERERQRRKEREGGRACSMAEDSNRLLRFLLGSDCFPQKTEDTETVSGASSLQSSSHGSSTEFSYKASHGESPSCHLLIEQATLQEAVGA